MSANAASAPADDTVLHRSYLGVLLATAYLTALWWFARGARRARIDPDALTTLDMRAIVGALAGAKLLLLARTIVGATAADAWSFVTSAGDFYGGFIGALVAAAADGSATSLQLSRQSYFFAPAFRRSAQYFRILSAAAFLAAGDIFRRSLGDFAVALSVFMT